MFNPQMMPLNWLTLLMYFSMVFMLFNMMNYFCILYHPKMSHYQIKNIKYSWKW
uniref:ATP synthase complex subunit 8 n=1 Tax=Byctiscus populi TaxID=1069883 RepID=J9PHA7_BYCPO|nr:ATP synthase F0 subunit 8 [Byctiscus populi]